MPSDVFSKLRFTHHLKSLVVNAPDFYLTMLSDRVFDTPANQSDQVQYDFVQLFAHSQNELMQQLEQFAKAGKHDCLLWACYPRGTGKIKSDINRQTVWDAFTRFGLRPATQISIDDTWSALRARPAEMVGK